MVERKEGIERSEHVQVVQIHLMYCGNTLIVFYNRQRGFIEYFESLAYSFDIIIISTLFPDAKQINHVQEKLANYYFRTTIAKVQGDFNS